MADEILDGSGRPVDLGFGYTLRAPGLVGRVVTREERTGLTRGPEQVTPEFDEALQSAGIEEVRTIDLDVAEVPAPADAPTLRTAGTGEDALALEVPVVEGHETIVLAANESGGISWIYPEERSEEDGVVTRGNGPTNRFLVPREVVTPPADLDVTNRGVLGFVGRKILKVLVYPIADFLLNPVVDYAARRWETARRPYGVRTFTPDDFTIPGGRKLEADDWQRLGSGPALLFIHGTFSTTHGAFGELDPTLVADLHQRYGGRVFAFDHHTMSDSPDENARRLIAAMPDGLRLRDVDIVCHSRGGLVSRTLAENPTAFDVATERVDVRRVVFVAAPNAGTALADAKHMVQFLDRLTTVLNLFSVPFLSDFLEALLTAVKVLGHAGLRGLPGLASMDPRGAFLRKLNATGEKGATRYYALAAEYEPEDPGLRSVTKMKVADAVIDRVFRNEPNDLVVPTLGVFEKNGSAYFPIDERLSVAPSASIFHTRFFGYAQTQEMLGKWLGAG
ncbi:MAG TPA: alpha/beta fold hydrolase [Thermoanaerobaculia bacterium]|jgi:pimeloyl-ACP methyl ester carboxylesterase